MLKYTVAAFNKTVKDIKNISVCFNLITMFCYIAYLAYTLIFGIGNMYANIALSVLTLLYLAYYIAKLSKMVNNDNEDKIRHTYKFLKLSVNAMTLGIAIYGIFNEAVFDDSAWITVLLCVLWVLQFLLEIITIVLEDRIRLFQTALTHDLNGIVSFINVFKIDDIQLPKEDEQQRKKLDVLVEIANEEKKKRVAKKVQDTVNNVKEKVTSVFVKNK